MSKQLLRSAKNVVNGYSQAQVLVRNATSNEEYGPSLDQMEEIAERTYSAVEFFEIMVMLEKRLNDKPKHWRHVAKSLTVTDFLVRAGAETCVNWARENIYLIRKLTEFVYIDESSGIDHGQLIRVKSKELVSLLRDDERLRDERSLRLGRRRGRKAHLSDEHIDHDLQCALEASRITAEEDERRRKEAEQKESNEDLKTAIQLSKEEEELRKLRELQLQRDQQMLLWKQQQQQQQQPVYYDIFGNPITLEEYLQYRQQQEIAQQQQLAQQMLLAQQIAEQKAAEKQYLAQQQYLLQQQQYLAQKQFLDKQQQLPTGPNNPFSLSNMNKMEENNDQKIAVNMVGDSSELINGRTSSSLSQPQIVQPHPETHQLPPVQAPIQQAPLKQMRTGNEELNNKFGELNTLLATGTDLDTFGNTGQSRIPAQHTKTDNFVNSQGTGFKQVSTEILKHNPFLASQYTGLPSSNLMPSHTGYGFGNNSSNYQQSNNRINDQGLSLIDL